MKAAIVTVSSVLSLVSCAVALPGHATAMHAMQRMLVTNLTMVAGSSVGVRRPVLVVAPTGIESGCVDSRNPA
jgi:hypothetical protein